MKETRNNLEYLRDLSDYRVAAGYSDIRGWTVKSDDDLPIGKVDGLLVNKKAGRVIYIDVQADDSVMHSDSNSEEQTEMPRHFIVPVRLVNLDDRQTTVTVRGVDHDIFRSVDKFSVGDDVTRSYELNVLRHYVGDDAAKRYARESGNDTDMNGAPDA